MEMKSLFLWKTFLLIYVCEVRCWEIYREKQVTKDNQCAARVISGKSVVCVCNETYFDTITREVPAKGRYISYTSSESGLRFKKRRAKLEKKGSKKCKYVYELDPAVKYQTIEGFGAAVTGSASHTLKCLPVAAQDNLIRSYFGDQGLEYNMLRVPIGGCDFSLTEYAYNELPVNDCYLTNYTLSCEDIDYKIPTIKRVMEISKSPVHLVASTWSPPKWMKYYNEHSPTCGFLKAEYFQTYADYHLKFIEQYASNGVPVWGITTTNEPSIAYTNIPSTCCLGWSMNQMGKWIVENLGPTIRKSKFKDTKILALDDQRFAITHDFYDIIRDHPKVLDYIDGIAVHFYYDSSVSEQVLQQLLKSYPNLFILSTEACEGFRSFDKKKVDLGSWERAESYIKDIIQNLNADVVGWLDWNLCLDDNGGPNWMKNFVDSPIIVNAEEGEFVKQPMYYAMGHFSKFIPRGSRRIAVKSTCSLKSIEQVAFLTPRNTIVFIVYNDNQDVTKISIRLSKNEVNLALEGKSITTIEFTYDDSQCNTNTALTLYADSKPVILKLKATRITIQVK